MDIEQDAFIGRQLGAYQIQSRLGEGGMATVYKAYHAPLRREVAIKIIRSQSSERASFQARFEREAQVIANLDHPNIVNVYDFGDAGDISYLVMQYVGGGTLREQLRGKRPLAPQLAISYAIQMAHALHHAHQRGIVHRDVKPQNMLVSSANPNHLLLSDFGIAKLYGGGEDSVLAEMPTHMADNVSELTNMNQIIGTADYMSPEQVHARTVDARTDVYALGIVLYQMLTGEVPFQSDSLRGLLFQQAYTPPPSLRTKNPRLPEILEQITAKAIAKAPADRFQTAEAMAQALEQANINATDGLNSFVHGTSYSPSISTNQPVQQTNPGLSQQSYTTFAPPGRQVNTNTRDEARTVTIPSGLRTSITPPPGQLTALPERSRVPLTYIFAALVVIIGLIVVGIRVLPGWQSNASTSTTSSSSSTIANGPAKSFTENFYDDTRGWQQGSALGDGVQAQVKNNQYTITTSQNDTSFAYPQNIGALPANFTLSAMLEANTGNLWYGIAFHFTEVDTTHVDCYALLIDNTGNYEILELGHGYNIASQPLWSGQYSSTTAQHRLQIQAQGNNYAFSIDGQTINTDIDKNTTLKNTDLQNGGLALVVTGPQKSGQPDGDFVVTQVKLTVS